MNNIEQKLTKLEDRAGTLAVQIDSLLKEVQTLRPLIDDARQGKRCRRLESELLNLHDMLNPSRE